MKRETIIAIVFGILLGAGAGLVVLFQTNSSEEAKVIPIESDEKKVVSQAPAASSQAQLIISDPQSHTMSSEDTITITGRAPMNGLIMVQSQTTEQIFKSEKGDFTVDMPLTLGENVINVSVYAGSSTPQEQVLRVYYVPQE